MIIIQPKLVSKAWFKPGLHVRLKHKNKHKHKDVYTCDKHKHNETYASAEAAEIWFQHGGKWQRMSN